MIKNSLFIFVFVSLYACMISCEEECLNSNTEGYHVEDTLLTTPNGISVDISGQSEVELIMIDYHVDDLEYCLQKVVSKLDDWERKAGSCDKDYWNSFERENRIDRNSFTVKIDPDWRMSHDLTRQLLSAKSPTESCKAKGISPTENCPCRWQSAVQDCNVVVVTPSLNNIKEAVVRVVLGCQNPWYSQSIAACMNGNYPVNKDLYNNFEGRHCWE